MRLDGCGLVGMATAVGWWVWMVVRFVCVIRVIRVPVWFVSRLPPVSFFRYEHMCVPAPPCVFLPVRALESLKSTTAGGAADPPRWIS